MSLKPHRRSAFWVAMALTGLCAGVFLLGVHAEKPKREPQTMVRSAILPVLADGKTLKDKVVEARRIALALDRETLAAKAKLPNVAGVFDPIHLGLAKPAKPGEYGGGMVSRLEFIQKNLTKSLQTLARLPSSCDRAGAQWRAGVAAQQLLIKTIAQARQAKAQATWTAQESDKLIQTALRKLKDADDETSAAALDAYNKKLQSGLAAVAKALGEGLAGKSLDKKVMPKLGGRCGSVQAMELPTQKEVGMQLASAASKFNGAKTAVPISSKSKSAKSDAALLNARGGGGSSAQKGPSASLDSGKADTSKNGKSLWAAPAAVISPSAVKSGTPLAVADIRKALAAASSDEFTCPIYSGPADCPKLADIEWWITYFKNMLKISESACRWDPTVCDPARQGLKLAQDCKAMYLARCKCPDGSMPDKNGKCPPKKCPAGQVLKDESCGCAIEGQKPNSEEVCVCPEGQVPARKSRWNPLSVKICSPACEGKAYDPKKGCCADGKLNKGQVADAKGVCRPLCGQQTYDPDKDCCDKLGKLHEERVPTWWGLSCGCPKGQKAGKDGKCACPEGQLLRKNGKGCGPKLQSIRIEPPSATLQADGPAVTFTAVLTPDDAVVDLQWSIEEGGLVASAKSDAKTGGATLGLSALPPATGALAASPFVLIRDPNSPMKAQVGVRPGTKPPPLPEKPVIKVWDILSGLAATGLLYLSQENDCRKLQAVTVYPPNAGTEVSTRGGREVKFGATLTFAKTPEGKPECQTNIKWSVQPPVPAKNIGSMRQTDGLTSTFAPGPQPGQGQVIAHDQLEPTAKPGSATILVVNCDLNHHNDIQAVVDKLCSVKRKCPDGQKAANALRCEELQTNLNRIVQCLEARKAVADACFDSDPDKTHSDEINKELGVQKNCVERFNGHWPPCQ